MNYVQLGSIMVPAVWLAVILALLITPILYRAFFKMTLGDWYGNAALVYLLTWKLSYIALHFQMFMETPVSIIYFNGGVRGVLLALLFYSLYIFFRARRKYPDTVEQSGPALFLFLLTYAPVMSLLDNKFMEALLHVGVLIGFLLMLHATRLHQRGAWPHGFLVIVLLHLLIISLYQSLFTIQVLVFTWMGMVTLILFISRQKGGRENE